MASFTSTKWMVCSLFGFLLVSFVLIFLNQGWQQFSFFKVMDLYSNQFPKSSPLVGAPLETNEPSQQSTYPNPPIEAPSDETNSESSQQSTYPNRPIEAPFDEINNSEPSQQSRSPSPPIGAPLKTNESLIQQFMYPSPPIEAPISTNEPSQQDTYLNAPIEAPWKPNETTIRGEVPVKSKCNIFQGKWVYDPQAYPLYHASQCPFLGKEVSCQRNGRPDSDYEHWRWEPSDCSIPRFDGSSILEMMRGKRIVMVGDSLNRNMWESLSCLLYSSIPKSQATIDSTRGDYKVFKAKDYNCTVEFYWSPFIVPMARTGRKVIKLDELPENASRWPDADVLVFNTGHWWTHKNTNGYEHDGKIIRDINATTALELALQTWAQWIDSEIDPTRTTVFFRSVSPEHKKLHPCHIQTTPIPPNETYIQYFPQTMVEAVENTISRMTTPVEYLNITSLSEIRRDGHSGLYNSYLWIKQGQASAPDCSHWCVPGLPDTWNVLVFATLFAKYSNQI